MKKYLWLLLFLLPLCMGARFGNLNVDGTTPATGQALRWNGRSFVPSSVPYASFSDSTTQTIANTGVAYPITFNTNVRLLATAAAGSPTRPAAPSAICTVKWVSG